MRRCTKIDKYEVWLLPPSFNFPHKKCFDPEPFLLCWCPQIKSEHIGKRFFILALAWSRTPQSQRWDLREAWQGDVCADLPICVTLSDEKEISAQYRISKEEQYLRGWENNFYRKLTFIEIESGYLPLCVTNLLLYRMAESARRDEAAKGLDR